MQCEAGKRRYLKRRFSRESWSIDVQPISFIPRSISARIRPRARSTPAWPAAASGYKIEASDADGLGAERQRLQDVRSALDAAVHDHVDPIADGIDDFGQLIERRARAVELPAAVVGQDDAGAADLGGALGVGHRHDALQAELAVP